MYFFPQGNTTEARIRLDLFLDNFLSVKRLAKGKRVIAVVKADAYGHGAVALSRFLSEVGCSHLAVSSLREALELRLERVTLPILILGYTPPECADILSRHGLTQCVFSEEYAAMLSSAARSCGCRVSTHVKVDTGMSRLGFSSDGAGVDAILRTTEMPGLDFEGIFTHLSSSDEPSGAGYTVCQAQRFSHALDELVSRGRDFEMVHSSNSGALFNYPDLVAKENTVRAGIVLYGYPPSDKITDSAVTPVMTLVSTVSQIRSVAEGTPVGYGCSYVTPRKSRIATVSVGYADGFPRGQGLLVGVRGVRCPVVGRVCMDQIMIDVTDTDVRVGDEVTVIGAPGLSASRVAELCGTIAYEVLCGVSRRVPRVYLDGERVVGCRSYL